MSGRSRFGRRRPAPAAGLALGFALGMWSCGGLPADTSVSGLQHHMVAFHPDGRPLHPNALVGLPVDSKFMTPEEYDAYVDRLLRAFVRWHHDVPDQPTGEPSEPFLLLESMHCWEGCLAALAETGAHSRRARQDARFARAALEDATRWLETWLALQVTRPGERSPAAADIESFLETIRGATFQGEPFVQDEVAPRGQVPALPDQPHAALGAFRAGLERALSAISGDHPHRLAALREGSERNRIALFIHGGLNDYGDTVDRVNDLTQRFLDGPEPAYPIFIAWDSSLRSCYFENLAWSEDFSDPLSWLLAPFVVATDVAGGLLRLGPRSLRAVIDPVRAVFAPRESTRSGRAEQNAQQLTSAGGPPVDLAGESPKVEQLESGLLAIADFYRYHPLSPALALGPVRLTTSFFVDTFGKRAWEGMRRRTDLLFSRDDGTSLQMALPTLLRLLAALQEHHQRRGAEIEVLLFAHSMGTFIANGILRTPGELAVPHFPEIVYMAAACSLKDLEGGALHYLEHDPEARLDLLMLHPEAEEEEVSGLDLGPRGSLLVYIDDYLTEPRTLRERTAGRFDNFLPVALEYPNVAGRIRVRVFGRGSAAETGFAASPPGEPEQLYAPTTRHSDFTRRAFWRAEYRAKDR